MSVNVALYLAIYSSEISKRELSKTCKHLHFSHFKHARVFRLRPELSHDISALGRSIPGKCFLLKYFAQAAIKIVDSEF